MRRQAFNLAAVLSILFSVATTLLWARSYAVAYHLIHETFDPSSRAYAETKIWIGSGRAAIFYDRSFFPERYAPPRPCPRWEFSPEPEWSYMRQGTPIPWHLGFIRDFHYADPRGTAIDLGIGLNLLILVAAACIPPGVWTVQHVRRRRRRLLGLCPTYRYNLTANTSGTCPECGTPTPHKPRIFKPNQNAPPDGNRLTTSLNNQFSASSAPPR